VYKANSEGWLYVKEPVASPLLATLKQQLDAGEAEAIALTLELPD
jgi:predicted nucleic acid-binding protein